MANERLRAAMARDRWTVSGFADALSVDHKTVERWITKDRTPHRTTVIAAAKLLNEDPAYLSGSRQSKCDGGSSAGLGRRSHCVTGA
jgi:transcriptional regulator with XRE-family HTH domain